MGTGLGGFIPGHFGKQRGTGDVPHRRDRRCLGTCIRRLDRVRCFVAFRERTDASSRRVRCRFTTPGFPLSALTFSFQNALTGLPAAILEMGLVLAPQAEPLRRLTGLRSPLWAALLPASIIVGTFGLIALPRSAPATLLIAAVTTPVLALLAIVSVVRARLLLLPVAVVAGGLALLAHGLAGQLGAAVVTALACLTIGAALQRLIPPRWLLAGVLAMSLADVLLLALGFGYHQTLVLAAAARSFHGPRFTGARVGGTTIGYPDLFLAALLGTYLAAARVQRLGAAMLGIFVVAYDSMLAPGMMLPATVPIAVAWIAAEALRRAPALRSRRRVASGHHRSRSTAPAGAAGG